MNGAIAVPSVRTINVPNNRRKKIIGANQNFFLTLKNSQNSERIDNLPIFVNLFLHLKLFVIILI